MQAMEKRLEEVEEENTRLRAALNLPPANRPPLGKGPTGKDKPKIFSSAGASTSAGLASPLASNSGATSSAESSRTSSLSPSAMAAQIASPTTIQAMDNAAWDQAFLRDSRPDGHASPAPAPYRLSAVTPSMSQKSPSQYSMSTNPLPSTSRQSVGNIYIPTEPPNYAHTADRPPPPSGAYDSGSNFLLRDVREDSQQYSYSQPGFSPTSNLGSLHHQPQMSDSPSLSSLSGYQQREPGSALSNLPYSHRRSITEPLGGFRGNVGQYTALPPTTMPQQQGGVRLSPPTRLLDVPRAGHNPGLARINQLP